MDPHRLAEERSLALHRAVAERIRAEPGLIEAARKRVAAWIESGQVSPRYAGAWQRVLELPVERICVFLGESTEEARALRAVTPFAGVIDPRARWRIWKDVAAASKAGTP